MSLSDFIASNVPFNVPYHLTHYVPGETPLSTNKSVATALVSYLAIVFGLRELMKTRKPLKLQALFQIHNVNLTLGSGLLLALMAEELLPIWMKSGTFIAACDESSWTTVRSISMFTPTVRLTPPSETRILLYDKLLFQIPRTLRHCVSCSQEEASW